MKSIQKIVWVMILAGIVTSPSFAGNEVKVTRKGDGIRLENEFIEAEISAKGGKLIFLRSKITDWNFAARAKSNTGLNKSRIYQNLKNRELIDGVYSLKIIKNNSEIATVRCAYTAKDKKYVTFGFEFVKEYTLRKNEARLTVKNAIFAHNSTGEFSPFFHNLVNMPQGKNYAFCQAATGLFCKLATPTGGKSDNLILDPAFPWAAVIFKKQKQGIVITTSEHLTKGFFLWLGNEQYSTIEPLMKKKKFAADSIWKADIGFIPVNNIDSCHFANRDYAGGFVSESEGMQLKIFAAATLGEVDILVMHDKKQLAKATITLKAGETSVIPVESFTGTKQLTIKIIGKNVDDEYKTYASGTIKINTKGSVASVYSNKENKRAKKKPARVYSGKPEKYVSPDMTTFITFRMDNKLPKKTKPEYVIDMPKGITLIAPMLHNAQYTKARSIEKITIAGEEFTRYVFPYSKLLVCFTKTDWKAGKNGVLYYYARWKGGKQKTLKAKVISVEIPVAPLPKRMITNLGWMSAAVHSRWPDFYNAMKRIGINTVCSVSYDAFKPEKLEKQADTARAHGLFFAANYSPFGGFMRKDVIKEGCGAVSLFGKTSSWVCPSSRGVAFNNEIERIAAIGKAGISMLWLDCEFWGGASYCFCPRCMRRFKEFFFKKHNKMKYISPKTFMLKPANYPKYVAAWDEFRAELGNEMYGALAERFKKGIAESGKTSGPYMLGTYGAMADGLYSEFFRFDKLYKKNILNTCMPSAYTAGDAVKVAKILARSRAFLQNSDTLPWLSAGYDANSECEAIEFRYCLLESFLTGTKGFTLFTWKGCDANDLRELSIAMSMLVPSEDIIMDGKVIKSLKVTPRRARIAGLELGDEKLILVSDYYNDKKSELSFQINVNGACRAIDMRTRKVISELKKGINTIKVEVPPEDRARLIYIGKKNFSE